MTSYEEDLVEQVRITHERLRNTSEELAPIARAYIPIASYRKALREQLAVADRAARLALWKALGASEQQHCTLTGTGIVAHHRNLQRRLKAYQNELKRLAAALERERKRPQKAQRAFDF